MADEDPEQDETPEPPQRLFTLSEAESVRKDLEPFLVEAIDCRKKLSGLDNDLSAVSARIMMMGGVIVPYEKLSKLRSEHTQLAQTLKSALNRILETGCIVKDLDVGLLDFPDYRQSGCLPLLETRRRPHPLLSSPGRRLCRPQAARPQRPRPRRQSAVALLFEREGFRVAPGFLPACFSQ